MNSTDIWQQILAEPQNEALKTQFIAALQKAKDRRAETFHLAAKLEEFPVYYVQHEAIARQYESSLEAWSVERDTARTWGAEINFVKGWPIEITIDARNFQRHVAEIITALPIRHVNLKAVADAPEVFEVPPFAQIASLNGSGERWSNAAIRALANAPHLLSLRWLALSDTQITDADVEILAASPNLRNVEHLDLSSNPCRDPVDAAAGYGTDGFTGLIVPESIWLPEFGKELEARYGTIRWLHALGHYMEKHPPDRYLF